MFIFIIGFCLNFYLGFLLFNKYNNNNTLYYYSDDSDSDDSIIISNETDYEIEDYN